MIICRANAPSETQKYHNRMARTDTHTDISTSIGGVALSASIGLRSLHRQLSTSLLGAPLMDSDIDNDFALSVYQPYLTPVVILDRPGLRVRCTLPLSLHCYYMSGSHTLRQVVLGVAPGVSIRYDLSSRLLTYVSGGWSRDPARGEDLSPAFFQTDYRDVRRGREDATPSSRANASVELEYSDPFHALFLKGGVDASWMRSRVTPARKILGGVIYSYYVTHPSFDRSLSTDLRLSKGFLQLSTVWTVGLSYRSMLSHMITQGDESSRYRINVASVYSQVTLKPTSWSSLLYRMDYDYSGLPAIDVHFRSICQRIEYAAELLKGLRLEGVVSHYYNIASMRQDKSFLVSDLSMVYSLPRRNGEISLRVDNLFDVGHYTTREVGELSETVTTSYLRPRQISLGYFIHF